MRELYVQHSVQFLEYRKPSMVVAITPLSPSSNLISPPAYSLCSDSVEVDSAGDFTSMKSSVPINTPVMCRRQLNMGDGVGKKTDSHSKRSSNALVSLSLLFASFHRRVHGKV